MSKYKEYKKILKIIIHRDNKLQHLQAIEKCIKLYIDKYYKKADINTVSTFKHLNELYNDLKKKLKNKQHKH